MDANRTDRVTEGALADRWRHLTEHIQDAVVEFEFERREPIVRSVNQSFVDTFGYDRDEVRGSSLNEYLVPEWLAEEARSLDQRTADGEVNYQRVKRQTADGLREFLYRGIPYDGDNAGPDGVAVYTDLTEINRYERQTRVLNRVLRHNLRNQANVIIGHTTRLLDRLDGRNPESTDTVRAIQQAAYDLERLTREAAEIQDVLDDEYTDETTVDCVPLLYDLVGEYRRANRSVDFALDLPSSLPVKADGRLRFALDSLLDNAVEHNPADEPRVRVTAGPATDGWVDLYIDDDGPRIPETERRVLVDQAEITPLSHGSGLGLWLVKWTVEEFGGELSFETNEMGGNRVALRLRR